VNDRFPIFRETLSRMPVPLEVVAAEQADFHAEIKHLRLGPLHVISARTSPCRAVRTPRLIRKSDPGMYQLDVMGLGEHQLTQGTEEIPALPADLLLYDTSRPFRVRTTTAGKSAHGLMLVIPRTVLPLPPDRANAFTPAVFSGRDGMGALLLDLLTRIVRESHHYKPEDAVRLGTVVVDLLSVLLARHHDAGHTLPDDTRRRELLLRVQAYIHRNLYDPELSPNVIAATHGISARTLHRLFQPQGTTVAEWIRERRLERCRRDLADPALRHRPIHAIAARWGFSDAAHFSRAFRAAYGVSAQEYRRQHEVGDGLAAAVGG
jgi:AraC-like DNA-binding protein